MGTITEEFTIKLGATLTYIEGEVVFWGGLDSALGRIDNDYDFTKVDKYSIDANAKFENSINNGYVTLHYSYLRPATTAEKAILGDREFVRYIPNK